MRLDFQWNETEFQTTICEGNAGVTTLPRRQKGQPPPTERFHSLATAHEYVKPQTAETEDDILHMWDLPNFGELDLANVRALGQHDSELLLSYLTVPYLRIPLVIAFFSTDDRIHSLQSPMLQHLFDSALFEPGNHLPLKAVGVEPVDVPTSAPELLGTPHHLLINELCRSPSTLVGSIQRLTKQALDLDTGTLKSSTATIILYMTRLACRLDSYVAMVLACDNGTHELLSTHTPERPIELGPTQREELCEARTSLQVFLWSHVSKVLRRWHMKLVKECIEQADEETLDRNTKHMCNLQAHSLMCMRNLPAEMLDVEKVTAVVRGVIFLSTRHQVSRTLAPPPPPILAPTRAAQLTT